MADATNTALIDPRDPMRALVLLTRLPVPGADGSRGAASAWAWPVAGLVVGGLAGAVAFIALFLGLPPAIAAGLALASSVMMTGALHEDGLADCADGFWGAADPKRRLEIMKDSWIGAYGVIALIIVLGLKWLALTELVEMGALWAALLVPAALSRAAMGGLMAFLPFAREDGLARHVGQPSKSVAGVGVGLAALTAVALSGPGGIAAALITGATTLGVASVARSRIGGQTGDVLGAAQQVAELASLLALIAVLSP